MMRLAILSVLALGLAGGVAHAYPQYQLRSDQTCTSCHLSPAGGNLLNENGLIAAETHSQFGTAPEFFYGKIPTPEWLVFGGDLRGSAGYIQTPERVLAAFPMQAELYGSATLKNFSLHATFGNRPAQFGNETKTRVWSREHYLMWQQNAGGSEGLYARVGRFMPVFGLRIAEHPSYIRRFGGTSLYTDTYGVAVEYVSARWEAHATGFIEDPLIDTVDHSRGGAAYAEVRVTPTLAVGAEGMFQRTDDDKKIRGGVTGKLYLECPDVLLLTELQFVNQLIDRTTSNPDGGAPVQLVGYLGASKNLTPSILMDIGIGHYDSNIRVKHLDRNSLDLNLHWFTSSHVELVLNARYEMLAFGKGGRSGAYTLMQLHYRL
ncbi:MAG: hypothetical protein AB7O24_11775 [Kofleriaceae bacterium]